MKNNKIIIALNEKIFLEFCKALDIKNIKTNEEIIIGEKDRENSQSEDETLIIIHGKDIEKTTEFIKNTFIYIEKIILINSAEVFSNSELQKGDIIIPNTFLGSEGDAKFLENTIGEDYDLNNFGLILNGICSDKKNQTDEFQADIFSHGVFNFLHILEKEGLIEKTTAILQIGDEDYTNVIAVSDMSV